MVVTRMAARNESSTQSDDNGPDRSLINLFHQRDQMDHGLDQRSQDRSEGRDDKDLNLKIEIPGYHGSLRGYDFLHWLEVIKRISDYKDVSD